MRSMTGFGQAAQSAEEVGVAVEIRTVNSRYLDLKVRLPKELAFLEGEIRKELGPHLVRGRVDVHVDLVIKRADQYDLNQTLVENYLWLAEKARSLGAVGEVDVSSLLQLPGVVIPRQVDSTSEPVRQAILEVVREAAGEVVAVRRAEGAALKMDLEKRLSRLAKITDLIAEQTALVQSHYREKLMKRLADLVPEQAVDENRLAQEMVYFADRSDISEEITRLRSHLEQFQVCLDSEEQVVGRRLDFICQEMGREMNTVLSKSPLAAISEPGVEGKTEIEKIREQVQNVE
ncbi:MAG: YicC/YloC family endoribonuclease [Acidobacteriota bacterium]